ncbi:DUF2382 domain-containing protein [Chroococcidiopsis sp. FACHB-1243]|uniref:DUF2382 domain-containing protein n=1 Tax=Chroococcidiopsis sp. [FACHB-1243] TaxID=2692781 RepID=UPI001784BB1F|nr:DUF2382 domain-containing protein [Chroococcidiopsis sp. [FACHB-1243]]MBD2307929.1 DUF2382 domain-containing protein [Chroococcidiopsis sp. [FACHB-1243]]
MIYPTSDRSHFNFLVEKLRKKLKNFFVVNLQGDRIGIVKDIIVDRQQQLQLIVFSKVGNLASNLQINSKQIRKIEVADKVVAVDFTFVPEEIERVTQESDRELHSSSSQDIMMIGDRLEVATSEPLVRQLEVVPPELSVPMTSEIDNQANTQLSSSQDISTEEIIKLLAERVVVERKKRKVGEVIVRKEIETRMVEVPVRYEKLIVEQVNPEHKQIAEINLGQETLADRKLNSWDVGVKNQSVGELTVTGRFDSPKVASLLLNAIARERQHGCQQIRVEIVVDSPEKQKLYQEWCDRCSQ